MAGRDRVMVDMKGLGPRVRAHCQAADISLAEFILPLLTTALGVSIPQSQRAAPKELEGGRRRLSVLVDAATYEALDKIALGENLSVSALVGHLAAERSGRSADSAVSTSGTVAALVRSNYELRAIGRNINQIAHSLNAYPGKVTEAERAELRALSKHIDTHVRVSAAILAGVKPTRSRRRSGSDER